MEYRIFSFEDEPSVVFVQDGETLMQFSSDKEDDKFFTEWLKSARKEGNKVDIEWVSTGFTYYTSEKGDYAKDKAKVAKIIEGFGYDAP